MKAIKKRLKTTAWFLTALMLSQSCVVYHKTSTTLDNAAREQINTRVATTDGDLAKYQYISYEAGEYYGVSKKSGEMIKTPLNPAEVNQVNIKNKSASTWATVAIITVPAIAALIIYIVSVNSIEGVGWGEM